MKLFFHKFQPVPIYLFLWLTVPVFSSHAQGLLREYWSGVTGSSVSNLTANANFPDNPNSRSIITVLEAPANVGDNHGSRIRGYVVPPSAGSYTFWISSDDNSELWLSTNNNPANKVLIASVTGYTNSREWTKYSSQQSTAKTLTAGQRYYIEVLHKDGTGGDHVAVGWQGPGITGDTERPIPASRLVPYETGLLREVWTGISGTSVSNLTSSANYPGSPTTSETIYTFESPSNVTDNYGSRIRGYVVPPTTGSYTLWIASDDNSELWLSTSEDPANKALIASVTGYTNSREWTKFSSQQSTARTLTAGLKYYIEVLHKEGTGGENLAVGWQGPGIGGDTERPIPAKRLLTWTGGNSVSYSLTMGNDGNGTTSPVGTISVGAGVATTITATPASGYQFINWTVTSGTATIANPASNNTTVTLSSGNASIRANFSSAVYTLTMSNDGNGTTTPAGTVNVNPGTPTAINAVPATGYQFLNWTVTSGTASIASPSSQSTTVSLSSGNASIRANFTLLYTLSTSTSPSASGTISLSPSGGNYPSGTTVTLTATPASGFQFSSWSGAVTGSSNPTTITMNANRTVTANFTAISSPAQCAVTYTQLTSTVNVDAGNTVVLSLPFTAPANGYITVTATGLYGTQNLYTHEQKGVECFITLNSTSGGAVSGFSEKVPMVGSAQFVNETAGFPVTAGANTVRLIATPRTTLRETVYQFVKCKMTIVFSTVRM